mmetsp:Transcript_18285/g.43723  ORF Transcript_18285/g.43723 Transcript_18285/m.43723 type:complete len:275 (+) Transcript_18285:264-1088(+)|eukprot:CAMPEP_0177594814 /NCGR_PEP_ID=MMETSP0419_2-20121207/9991_1 /TAXON_ID=582737 /ORGANISM="Tetraselmis sp., Strain GSL018" /LENGTH=274 /DNA_ID=CAMNT_0019086167 /DNA_START=209 /DNA_END=1033 /DNA_ORIENTATION=+
MSAAAKTPRVAERPQDYFLRLSNLRGRAGSSSLLPKGKALRVLVGRAVPSSLLNFRAPVLEVGYKRGPLGNSLVPGAIDLLLVLLYAHEPHRAREGDEQRRRAESRSRHGRQSSEKQSGAKAHQRGRGHMDGRVRAAEEAAQERAEEVHLEGEEDVDKHLLPLHEARRCEDGGEHRGEEGDAPLEAVRGTVDEPVVVEVEVGDQQRRDASDDRVAADRPSQRHQERRLEVDACEEQHTLPEPSPQASAGDAPTNQISQCITESEYCEIHRKQYV